MATNAAELPPRVLLIMPKQWPRALLRAELRERGYDALGTGGLAQAWAYPATESGRGPVRLLVVDDEALVGGADDLLARLRRRHRDPAMVLVVRAGRTRPGGPWRRVLQRPIAIDDIAEAVHELLPLAEWQRHPID